MERLIAKLKSEKWIYDEKILVCVSTGVDSMVLLDVLYKLQKDLKLTIIVAHVNHQKRKISDVEEEFIIDFCEKQNLKIYTKRFDFDSKQNFQAEARDKRYQFFLEIATKEEIKKIVLAHHADDNIETIMMRMIRGSNFAGYAGMRLKSEFRGIQVLRPMLTINKKQILHYAKERKLRYFEDESNFTDVYKRNRIRQNILPFLYFEEENVDDKFAYFSQTIFEASKIVEDKIDEFIEEHVEVLPNKITFLKDTFLNQTEFIQREIIFEILKKEYLSLATVDEIIKQIHSAKANIVNYVFEELTMSKEYEKISFIFGKQWTQPIFQKIDSPGTYEIENRYIVRVYEKKLENNEINKNLCYNIEMLPVIIRNRQPGDRIRLHAGEKKVSDLFIDLKIPKIDRDNLLVISTLDQNVLAIIGVKTSETLKNMSHTKYQIEIEEITYDETPRH
jgi:bifunctional protein TilS/HprT